MQEKRSPSERRPSLPLKDLSIAERVKAEMGLWIQIDVQRQETERIPLQTAWKARLLP